MFCVATLQYVAVYSLCTHPKICPPPPRSVEVLCTTPRIPPPPGGSAHFCLLPIINFLPRLTMLTPKDIEGQFICSDVILRQVRPDAVITAATLGVKLREPVWALWGSMRPLGTPSTTIPVTLLAARGEVVTGPRTKANPGLVEVRYKQEKGKTFWHPLRDILPMEQLPPGCREFHPDVIIESEQAEETDTSGSDTSYAAESDEEAASRKRTAQGTPGSGHKAKKKAKPAAKKAKKAPGRCVEREEILRMAAQIEETRNVPMDVLKTYSKASLHALLEQFELYFPQSAKHDMLVLRLKQAVEAGKNRPRLVPPEMPAGAYGYSRFQEQAVDGTNVDIAHPEDKAQDVANMGVHDHVGQQKQSPVRDQHGTGLPESPVRLEHDDESATPRTPEVARALDGAFNSADTWFPYLDFDELLNASSQPSSGPAVPTEDSNPAPEPEDDTRGSGGSVADSGVTRSPVVGGGMLGTMRPLPQEGLGVCVRKLPLAKIVLQKAQHAFGHVGRGDWAHDEAAVNLKLLPLHAVRDGASLSNDFAAIMQKLGTTGDYPYVGGYLAKISSGTGYTSAWAELRVGYTIFVPLKPTLWSMKVAGADIAIRNGEILQVPAMDERQTLKQPHEPGYLVVLQYGDPGLMLPSVIHAEVFAPCFTKIVSPQTHRQPFEPPPLHTQTQAHPPPPPPH